MWVHLATRQLELPFRGLGDLFYWNVESSILGISYSFVIVFPLCQWSQQSYKGNFEEQRERPFILFSRVFRAIVITGLMGA